MTTTPAARARVVPLAVFAVLALLAALMLSGLTGRSTATTSVPRLPAAAAAHAHHVHHVHQVHQVHQGALTARQAALQDRMRKLWEDHITWTRLAIVTFADGSDGFPATAARLLRNQVAIGDAIKPFYGKAAGNQLTALLHDHITIAVDLLVAAKAGDEAGVKKASARWYANANDIADFLAAANPKFWPRQAMRAAMKTHLDQTLAEASHELTGKYRASVRDYERVHHHILAMADTLSDGIIGAFPGRFR